MHIYIYVIGVARTKSGLLFIQQFAVSEVHPWHTSPDALDKVHRVNQRPPTARQPMRKCKGSSKPLESLNLCQRQGLDNILCCHPGNASLKTAAAV